MFEGPITVRFEPAGVELEAAPGDRLVDLTDEHPGADVPYSCRSASCGSCRVEVREGHEALAEVGEDEQEVLDIFGDPPGVRLCCQLEVRASRARRITLRILDP